MAGAGIELNIQGIEALNARLQHLASPDLAPLLDAMGLLVESQTRRRIEGERTDPSGKAWPDWSPEYALTRHSNHKLLQNEGHLVDSIQSVTGQNTVEVGTNIPYASKHQHGFGNIPKREFLGISEDNLAELQEAVEDWTERWIRP